MSRRWGLMIGVGLSVVCAMPLPAWATLANHKSFKAAYPDKDAKVYSCKTCHLNAIGKKGEHNAYGAALQQLTGAGKAMDLTVENYRAIEQDDADADGASTLHEINAGTNPGDPASTP